MIDHVWKTEGVVFFFRYESLFQFPPDRARDADAPTRDRPDAPHTAFALKWRNKWSHTDYCHITGKNITRTK